MSVRRRLTHVVCASALLLSSAHVSAQSGAAQGGPAALPPPPPPALPPPPAYPPSPAYPPAPALAPGGAYVPREYAAPLMVTVTLESTEPGVTIGLFPLRADVARSKAIIRCVDRCTTRVRPGRYKFAVAANEDVVGGSREVEIDADVHLLIDPDMVEHRSVGLAMGVGGIGLFCYGIYSVLHSVDGYGYDGRSSVDEAEQVRGALSIVASLVFIPVGWVMYGTSFKPEWDAIYSEQAKVEPRFNLGFAPVKDGGILGATLSF